MMRRVPVFKMLVFGFQPAIEAVDKILVIDGLVLLQPMRRLCLRASLSA
jgi:hypothetical protein